MLLKVGELARRAGLTVRTLHHYDQIGLLAPSGRSGAGYRLYSQADVQRLHAIQGLRQMGLALADIAALLQGGELSPQRILDQQMRALDHQIAQASELRARLALLHEGVMAGAEPDMVGWLEALALMNTYGKYFSAAELKHIFVNWTLIEADWRDLVPQVQHAMRRRLAPDDPQVQALAYRWMALMLHWMGGDLDLLERWGHMFRTETGAQGRWHAPPGKMIEFMEAAIKLRLELLDQYLARDELRALGHVPHAHWAQLQTLVQELLAAGTPAQHPHAAAAARRWDALLEQLTGGSAALRARLGAASACEPLLQAGLPLSAPVRAYLQAALACSAPAPAGG